jgi:radical SAM superfamily enzyme with C-terminal helix-hairpin-helix motif
LERLRINREQIMDRPTFRLNFSGLLLSGLLFTFVFAGCGQRAPDSSSVPDDTMADDMADDMDHTGMTMTTAEINLNTATEEQFRTIPGVGDRMVREFMEYRPYVSIQQFRQEIGKYVTAEEVAAFEEYVFVPVDPNNSDAETLQQIPGVDASVAEELIATRPYASPEEFLEALAPMVDQSEYAIAASYLTPQ